MENEIIKGEVVDVSLNDIIPNRFQPRLAFDEQALNELAKSIRQHGIIQPLVLRKVGNKYEIIAGERRFKASYIAGLTKVPAIILDLNDNESAEVAIVENLQRQDLSPIEEAKSYKKLLDRGYLTQEQLAARMGKTQATISNKLRLLNLSEKVQNSLLNNKISERHARSLLRIDDKSIQEEMLDEILKRRLNVRDTEEAITAILNGQTVYSYFNEQNLQNNLVSSIPHQNIINVDPDENKKDDYNADYSKNNFVNPSIDNLEKIDIKDNPIPFIRPILNDDFEIEKNENENLITDLPKQVKESSLSSESNNKKLEDVENKINNLIDNIKESGLNAKVEKYDFEDIYQFVIKVDKK